MAKTKDFKAIRLGEIDSNSNEEKIKDSSEDISNNNNDIAKITLQAKSNVDIGEPVKVRAKRGKYKKLGNEETTEYKTISVRLTMEEYEEYTKKAEESGCKNYSEYLKKLIKGAKANGKH